MTPTPATSFRWGSDFLARVDLARGLASRTEFIRQCVEQVLEGGDPSVSAILRRIPENRPALAPRPLSTSEALRLVQRRHAEARRRVEGANRGPEEE